jgi:probable HAF family extracellular repeat protein
MSRISLLALLSIATVGAGPIYTITDLGTLGGSSSQAFGISATGQAVGAATTAGFLHPFSSFGGGLTDLTGSAAEGIASGVNSAGTIVGTQYFKGVAYASEWTNGAAQTIAGASSYGMAINDSGAVAGMITTAGGQGNAFVMSNGTLVDLGTLHGGPWSSAYAINSSGTVAGYGEVASGVFRGFTWSPDTGFTELGTLGGTSSYLMAINDSGEAAGTAQLASGYEHAVIWNNGSLIDLGTLGGASSFAYGIDESGAVVGYSFVDGSGDTHAFIYLNGQMIDLNSFLDPSSGWTLTAAYAINSRATIVGTGLLNGVEHAFMMVDPPGPPDSPDAAPQASFNSVPEPATW